MGRVFIGFLEFLMLELESHKLVNNESGEGQKIETKAFYEFRGSDGNIIDINRKNTKFERDFTDVLMIYDSTRKTMKYIEEKE